VIKFFRGGYRLLCSLTLVAAAASDFLVRVWLRGRAGSILARAQWLKFWSGQFLKILRVEARHDGNPPERGVLACNHLSYLDILVLGSMHPFVFVSKSEVASWPVVGPVTGFAGTLYLDRRQKSDVVRLGKEMAGIVEAGVVVVLFLEGTSSDGSAVLPFRSSLLAPAVEHRWPATGGWIHYSLRDGSVANEVCYWQDMTFGTHFLNLLTKRRVEAHVSFGKPLIGVPDRKKLAVALYSQVSALKEGHVSAGAAEQEMVGN
jgi:1-acyl-sn-glycerol-3-phosphate acyltransferase